MSRVMTFSRVFPSYHPRAGQSTYFVEKILEWLWYNWESNPYHNVTEMLIYLNCGNGWTENEMRNFCSELCADIQDWKNHTIRAGHRWKVGDKFSPRVWSGKPYQSKQIIIAPDIEVKNSKE